MWRTGLNILRDRPLTGAGPGNMSRLYNLYRPIEVGAGAAHIQQLHGTPPHLLAELGLIGGAAIAFLLVQLIRLGWQIQKTTDDRQAVVSRTPQKRFIGHASRVVSFAASFLTISLLYHNHTGFLPFRRNCLPVWTVFRK